MSKKNSRFHEVSCPLRLEHWSSLRWRSSLLQERRCEWHSAFHFKIDFPTKIIDFPLPSVFWKFFEMSCDLCLQWDYITLIHHLTARKKTFEAFAPVIAGTDGRQIAIAWRDDERKGNCRCDVFLCHFLAPPFRLICGGLWKPRLRAAALGTSGIRGAEMVPNLVGNHGHFKLNLCCWELYELSCTRVIPFRI